MDVFSRAAEHVRGFKGLDEKTMLRFYSLYKQVNLVHENGKSAVVLSHTAEFGQCFFTIIMIAGKIVL